MSSAPADSLFVHEDIRRAESLPPAAFTDRDILARELDTIFTRSWLLVPDVNEDPDGRALTELVAQRGARVPFTLLGRPLFLQRGWDDDTLRCFPNTCTHAWYPLVVGAGRGNTIVCAQHGRKFDCAGRFLSQIGFTKDVPDFPRDCDHLRAFPITTWNDLLFVALGAPSHDPAAVLGPVEESITKLPTIDRLERVAAPAALREVAGNWKQHAWNYMDRFHVTFIHRAPGGLADAIDMASYRTELHGRASLQWAYARDPADGFDPAHLPDRFRDPANPQRRVFALWWFVFPNLTLNFYPWGLSINVYQPVPERPDTTRFLWLHRVLDREKYGERDARWLSAQVDAEDLDAMAQVRRGLRSGCAPRGRFSPTEELGPHWFHRLVSTALVAAT